MSVAVGPLSGVFVGGLGVLVAGLGVLVAGLGVLVGGLGVLVQFGVLLGVGVMLGVGVIDGVLLGVGVGGRDLKMLALVEQVPQPGYSKTRSRAKLPQMPSGGCLSKSDDQVWLELPEIGSLLLIGPTGDQSVSFE